MNASKIVFNQEITGNEPLPRSTNIKSITWDGEADYPLTIEFFGGGTYAYQVGVTTWQDLIAGVDAPDLYDDPERRSVGRKFWEDVRGKASYVRVK